MKTSHLPSGNYLGDRGVNPCSLIFPSLGKHFLLGGPDGEGPPDNAQRWPVMGCSSTAGGAWGEKREDGGMEGWRERALLCKGIVRWLTSATQVCVRKLFMGSHSSPAWSTPSLGWWRQSRMSLYRQNQPTWLLFLFLSIFIYASKLQLERLFPVMLIKWQLCRSLPSWFKESCLVFFRNLSWKEENATWHLSRPSQERRNNIVLEAV